MPIKWLIILIIRLDEIDISLGRSAAAAAQGFSVTYSVQDEINMEGK